MFRSLSCIKFPCKSYATGGRALVHGASTAWQSLTDFGLKKNGRMQPSAARRDGTCKPIILCERTPSASTRMRPRSSAALSSGRPALSSTLHPNAARKPTCAMDGTMHRAAMILTIPEDPTSKAAAPCTTRASPLLQSRCQPPCFVPLPRVCRILVPIWARLECPPDRPIWTARSCNRPYTAARPHKPKGLAPDGPPLGFIGRHNRPPI